jgi:hypothetical protein
LFEFLLFEHEGGVLPAPPFPQKKDKHQQKPKTLWKKCSTTSSTLGNGF